MSVKITSKDAYSIATIAQPRTRLFYLSFTADMHGINTRINPATSLIFDDLLLSGTAKKSKDEFRDALKKIGASISVEISNNLCTVTVKSLSEHAVKATKLLIEALESASLPAKEIKRAIDTAENNLEELKDNSRYISHAQLKRQLFSKDDRRHDATVDTLVSSISSVTRKDLQLLLKEVVTSYWFMTIGSNSTVITNALKVVESYKKSATEESTVYTGEIKNTPKLLLEDIPSKQNIDISIGSALPLNLHHEDYPAFVMALAVLGKWGGFAGRLMSTVREKEGLTYGIYSKTEGVYRNELAYWRIMTFFAPDKVITGLTSTFREIKKLYRSGVTNKELSTFKTILKTQDALVYDSLAGKFQRIHYLHVQGLSVGDYENYKERLQALTTKEVNAAIKKYLNPKTLSISCAGPVKHVKKELESFSKSV